VRDDELRRLLSLSNPWWGTAAGGGDRLAWTADQRLLAGRSRYDLGYRSDILSDIAAEPLDDSLVILTGPRRVGKSVAMLDAVATLCARRDIDPRQLIHVPCDGMKDRDLRRVITLARALTASADLDGQRRRAWFFDEISDVLGWTSVLKQARDLSTFGDDTVIATGSRWAGNEAVHGHLIAGRAGTAGRRRVRQLLPMSFGDYIAATNSSLPQVPPCPADIQSPAAEAALREVEFLVDAYDLAWQDYLTSGAFPRAVAEYARSGRVSEAFVRDLLGWLRTDIDPDAPQESVPLLLAEIAARASSPFNVRAAAESLRYGSRGILDRRIARLVNSYAALRCHQRDDSGRLVVGAQSKLYLVDPVLAWVACHSSPGLPNPDFTTLTESALAVALARRIEAADEGRWPDDDTIGYARTRSGSEVDFCPVRIPGAAGPAMTTPIESKWVDAGWRGDSRNLHGKYGAGVVATKSVLDLDQPVWAVPAPLVALLLAG
jgi:predicted AAA+ superfamily ATPase